MRFFLFTFDGLVRTNTGTCAATSASFRIDKIGDKRSANASRALFLFHVGFVLTAEVFGSSGLSVGMKIANTRTQSHQVTKLKMICFCPTK